MTILFVRVPPKAGIQRFFRCGIEFSRGWQEVEVDDATAARLDAEQMLEVTAVRPAELETEAANGTDLPADSSRAEPSPPVPAPTAEAAAPEPQPQPATADAKKRRA